MVINAGLMASSSGDWNTPACVLERVRAVDRIRLDPCSNAKSIVGAAVEWSGEVDGLRESWAPGRRHGLVYVNPPYGRAIVAWVRKMRREAATGVEVVALLPARTDSRWWQQDVFSTAAAVCFWRGRLVFLGAPASAPFPSAVAYWGPRPMRFQRAFAPVGQVVLL